MTAASVLGIRIHATTVAVAATRVFEWVAARQPSYVCLANVHALETARADHETRAALAASDLVLPDGAPVAWLVRRCVPSSERITGSDLFDAVCSASDGHRHFLLGATPAKLQRLAKAMASYEGVVIAGMYAPPFGHFSDEEIERQCAAIEAASPDIVWVGLGAPKQELWMARVRSQISAPVLIGVGAVFDFVSGTRRRAPRWMQCLGLEWSYRLGQEPKRLWRRYLKTNTSFVVATVWSALRGEVAA